ncbi:pyrroline-5-carboxylate reductase [Planctomycetota bacterium]
MQAIGFVGGGNMAEAIIKGMISAGLCKGGNIYVSDIRPERLDYLSKNYDVNTTTDNSELADKVGIIVLSVKPQTMVQALESIKTTVKDQLIISIAAGVTVANIADVLGDVGIVRVMPNTPALIGEGASALFANDRAKGMLKKAEAIFSAVGKAVTVDDEALIDAVTAVSGSGPAYFFLLIEKMVEAAVELGLPVDIAKELVLQTAKGAGLLAVEADSKGESPGQLRQKVTSPGGTTEAALKVFAEGKFDNLVKAAIQTACKRSKELSK